MLADFSVAAEVAEGEGVSASDGDSIEFDGARVASVVGGTTSGTALKWFLSYHFSIYSFHVMMMEIFFYFFFTYMISLKELLSFTL